MPMLAIIDLTNDDREAHIAIRHPAGGTLVLTVKAHRGALTVIGPEPVVVKVLEDSNEVVVSWRTDGDGT